MAFTAVTSAERISLGCPPAPLSTPLRASTHRVDAIFGLMQQLAQVEPAATRIAESFQAAQPCRSEVHGIVRDTLPTLSLTARRIDQAKADGNTRRPGWLYGLAPGATIMG